MKAVRKKQMKSIREKTDWVSPESTYIFGCAINLRGEKLASLQCFQDHEKLLLLATKSEFAVYLGLKCLL